MSRERLIAWWNQANSQLESWLRAIQIRLFGGEIDLAKLLKRDIRVTFSENRAWLQAKAKQLMTIALVGILVVVSWSFSWAGAGNSQFLIGNVEWLAMAVFAVASIAVHRFVGRTWLRSIGLTIVELVAWLFARTFFQNQRYFFMLTRWEATVRLEIAWIIGLTAWATRGKWTQALDSFFWRLRLLAELWQTLYTLFPLAKFVLNGAVFLGGAAVFFGGLLQNSWLWVVVLPILFVWLASALLKPPTTEEKIQRVEVLAARAAGIELPKKGHHGHGGAHRTPPGPHEVRPEDEPDLQHRPPRKPIKPH